MGCRPLTQALQKSKPVHRSVCEVSHTASSGLRSSLLPRREVGLWSCCLGFGEEREGVEYLES